MGSNPPRRPNCPGCKVTVTQRFEGTLPFPRPEHLADDHWRMALANLFAHLDGAPVLLADHDDPTPEVRLSLVIDAPPSAVFRALTVPELVDQWIGIGSRVDLRVGGGFDFGWSGCGAPESEPKPLDECPVKIVVLEQDRRLAITWPDWRGSPDVPDQEVRFELTPEGPGGKQTRVELLHTGFVRSVDRSDFTQGWYGFLEALADVAASAARTSAKRRG